jgi:D-arabinose 1-dehydrogenase-like Zn-dependent alcohol dehydrogenase
LWTSPGLGHFAIQFSRAMGYRTIALSSSPAKKALTRELGAHDYLSMMKRAAEEARLKAEANLNLQKRPAGGEALVGPAKVS